MAATGRLASATVGSLLVVASTALLSAQTTSRSPVPPAARIASFAAGSILGLVHDQRGLPVSGAVVSVLGATTTVAVTGKDGRFEFGTLAPGPYQLRVHVAGFVASRSRTVQVAPGARTSSTIALREMATEPILAAGLGVVDVDAPPQPVDDSSTIDEGGETAWRIRHARRGVLKDATIPVDLLTDDANTIARSGWGTIAVVDVLGRAVESRARMATSFIADTAFSGQVNLLTLGSFETPQELFSTKALARNIAYARFGAPVGGQADWTVRGALTQADISSWIVAGSYNTRAPARHRYDVGFTYATQQYDGGNVLALRDIAEGSRNAGAVYGYDTYSLSPALTATYGASYARYDYLNDRNLLSPRAELTLMPVAGLRLSAAVASRSLAPGAEEFLPPGDAGIWVPPQRTFSSAESGGGFQAERTTHVEVAVERDLGASTVAFRAFRQDVNDQIATLFGTRLPGQPAATVGHYVVGNAGDALAKGCSAGLRTTIGGRLHGALEYTMTNAQLEPDASTRYLLLLSPSSARPERERLHDLSTTIETEVPETATRVFVLYRVSNGFSRAENSDSSSFAPLEGRFDVQVRQSLPFMNFNSARWEMLLAVRNIFREGDTTQSVYDELLVVHPPKRIIGGVSLQF